jgi:hypothetical protein
MLSCAGVESKDEGIALVLPLAASDVKNAMERCIAMAHDPLRLARNIHPRRRRKYDQLLNDELLDISISRNSIDLPVALQVLNEVSASSPNSHQSSDRDEIPR